MHDQNQDALWEPDTVLTMGEGSIEFAGPRWPLRFVLGFWTAQSGDTVKSGDAAIGVHLGSYGSDVIRACLGGGITQLDATPGKELVTGAAVRSVSGTEFVFQGVETDPDFVQVAIHLGVSFKE